MTAVPESHTQIAVLVARILTGDQAAVHESLARELAECEVIAEAKEPAAALALAVKQKIDSVRPVP